MKRFRGYKDALAKFRIPYDETLVVQTGMAIADGKRAVEQLLEAEVPFDALFAFTDTLAIGAMNQLCEQDVAVPEEVAVASFSGTILSTIVYPQLTTVEQPLEEMGETAARLMLDKINDPLVANRTVTLDAKIRLRASTGVRGECKI